MLSEVIRSESAKRLGIDNMPPREHPLNLKILAKNIFQPIRNHFGVPIHISSGYRSVALNTAVKGSATSQHSRGEALDIDMDGSPHKVTNKMIFDFIKDNLNFDRIIYEFGTPANPDWVHVSYNTDGQQRKQVLKAIKIKGRTVYQNYQ